MPDLSAEAIQKVSKAAVDPSAMEVILSHWASIAAYLVAALSGLLYQNTRERMKEKEKSYTEQLKALHAALAMCITKEDFEKHEEREDRDRQERRDAERTLFDKIDHIRDLMLK